MTMYRLFCSNLIMLFSLLWVHESGFFNICFFGGMSGQLSFVVMIYAASCFELS